MFWCWHKWIKWFVTGRAVDSDFGTPITYQESMWKSKNAFGVIGRENEN